MKIDDLKKIAYKKKKGMPFYATKITHRISIRIVQILKKYDFSPNLITLTSILFGVLASFCFIHPKVVFFLFGAVSLEIYYLLDAVDGQYARTKGLSSTTGGYFDYLSNHIVHSIVFAAIGYGLYSLTFNNVYIFLGFFSAWGMLFMYIIHDAKYSILFNRIPKDVPGSKTSDKDKTVIDEKGSIAKNIFVFIHKVCIYPTIMNIITIFALLSYVSGFMRGTENLVLFKMLILFYGIMLNVIWVAKLTKTIYNSEVDNGK